MNYYQVLNIKETASKDEIKKAYNKLALTSHPDKNKSSDAAERFRSVNEAYKVLKDDNKRELYDRFELPKLKHTDPRSHNKYNQQRRRDRHDDTFFTGSSEIYSQEQRYQSELDRIRKINSDQLDAVNAQRRKSNLRNNRSGVPNTSKKSMGGRFVGDILADTNDDDYEKLVLERLRAMVGRS